MTREADSWPAGLAVSQVRIARPTDRLAEVVAFYTEKLGLPVLYRFEAHDGYDGVMLGLPDSGYHLEFTSHVDGSPCRAPTADNLLVLYFSGVEHMRAAAERLRAAGEQPVTMENPYWAAHGAVAFADPDGWRVVLAPEPAFQNA